MFYMVNATAISISLLVVGAGISTVALPSHTITQTVNSDGRGAQINTQTVYSTLSETGTATVTVMQIVPTTFSTTVQGQSTTTSSSLPLSSSTSTSTSLLGPYSATIDNVSFAIVGVFANVNWSGSGQYNITFFVTYSGPGSSSFASCCDNMQFVTYSSEVVPVGVTWGGTNSILTNGQFTYVYIYESMPNGEVPKLLEIFYGYQNQNVTFTLPASPYSYNVK